MEDISDFSGEPGSLQGIPSRTTSRIDEAERSVFDPGRVTEGRSWADQDTLHLSQEQAEKLNENREPGDVKYIFKVTDDPQRYLRWRDEVISASYVDYKRIHEGNLKDRLRLHTGGYDVPSGRENPDVSHDGDRSPFEVNLEDYRLALKKNKPLFQFIFYDWSYVDEEGDPGRSSMYSRHVDEKPEGWVSVAEVSEMKDQNQSAITRAIRHGELTAVMQKSPRKRWIKPDEDLDRWSPGRQENYLLRRRLKLIQEVLYNQLERPKGTRLLTKKEVMEQARRKEIRRFGDPHANETYEEFFEEEVEAAPFTLREWAGSIDMLVDEYCR